MKELPEVIFFAVGNGTVGYPAAEPFYSWLSAMLTPIFRNKEWLSKQDITAVEEIKPNGLPAFYVSAARQWVLDNCPAILDEPNRRFLVQPDYFAGYTEPENFQELTEQTKGKLYRLVNGEIRE